MKTHIKRCASVLTLGMFLLQIFPIAVSANSGDEVIYPVKEISKLECRFQDFDTLGSDCKQHLPVLHSKDYHKYATQNNGYNDYTRIYTVLWGASYKYGWDVGSGGHQGIDIATAKGTPVYSIADGVVIESSMGVGWGNHISIEHTINGQKIISNYAHLATRDVEKGDKVEVGDKIGGIGSTGNSTGNHLHFQIDLPNDFHPYYYDYAKCPYSYYEITETGVCFDELQKNTYDPIVFLENNGVVDQVEYIQVESKKDDEDEDDKQSAHEDVEIRDDVINTSSSNSVSAEAQTPQSYDDSIFSITVSPEMGTEDEVKQVQRIYNKLGYYDGRISGDYADVYESVITYQLDTNVISSRADAGAGWFGPKTRAQTQSDYDVYVTSGGQTVLTASTIPTPTNLVTKSVLQQKTVSRENLMTMEERAAKEVEDFLRNYNFDVENAPTHLEASETKISTINISSNKGRAFRGNTPGNVTFNYDTTKISVFPESFFNFTDGQREIQISGKTPGNTTLEVKIGEVVVKTFSITIGEPGITPESETAKIYMPRDTVLGDDNTGIILMKDAYGNNLVGTEYEGTYNIESDSNIEYCIKRGDIKNVKEIYLRSCYPEEYTDSLVFDYSDTISGVLIFDYKVAKTGNIKLNLSENGGKSLATNTLSVQNPKGLTSDYVYYESVLEVLQSGLIDGLYNGYFFQDQELTQADARRWIRNSLRGLGDTQMEEKLVTEVARNMQTLTRQDFLELTSTYLGSDSMTANLRAYRDMEENSETLVASLLGADYQWADDFGEFYFQPDKKITRGEATYLLTQAIKYQNQAYLVQR
ncbi:M23 family metallopeptidase [Candidatus Gracilibacteria bacterium]|nr:M23 family metallopeptidase [Candidatus Gracilibacteria bacterium]